MSGKAYLLLENGIIFEGEAFGADITAIAQLVFTTSMVGYLETLTDQCYYGQMVCQTFPSIGNYGVIETDLCGKKPVLSGYIVREWCQEPSNFRSEGSLDAFLLRYNIPGICNIDTRELTRILREHGTMNALLTTDRSLLDDTLALTEYKVRGAVEASSRRDIATAGSGQRVALWDMGCTADIANELVRRGCEVLSLPYSTSADDIVAYKPSGVVISDGPGNPNDYPDIVREVRKLIESGLPVLGIGMGHQLMALAHGAAVSKMKCGHRGASQPSVDLTSGKVYTTLQNHGYVVDASVLPQSARVSFVNVNDGTCEGIEYSDTAVSVQFRPLTSGSPQSTGFIYDRFIEMTEVL